MERRGAAEKALIYLTALGSLLVVVALVVFALTGSGFVPYLFRSVAGFVPGGLAMPLLTRSPRSGRLVAAVILLASIVGGLLFVLAQPSLVEGEVGFASGLVASTLGASRRRGLP